MIVLINDDRTLEDIVPNINRSGILDPYYVYKCYGDTHVYDNIRRYATTVSNFVSDCITDPTIGEKGKTILVINMAEAFLIDKRDDAMFDITRRTILAQFLHATSYGHKVFTNINQKVLDEILLDDPVGKNLEMVYISSFNRLFKIDIAQGGLGERDYSGPNIYEASDEALERIIADNM